MRATPWAVPCPLVDGISAARHCGVFTTPIDEKPGGLT